MSRMGDRIRDLRRKNNMDSKTLAKKLGVSESFVIEVEEGRRILNENMLDRLSKVFGMALSNEAVLERSIDAESTRRPVPPKTPSKAVEQAEVNPVWTNAVANTIAEIPVYDSSFANVIKMEKRVLENGRVYDCPPDRLMYASYEGHSLAPGITGGSLILLKKQKEFDGNGLYLVEYKGSRQYLRLKTLEGDQLLWTVPGKNEQAGVEQRKNIIVIAKAIRAETVL